MRGSISLPYFIDKQVGWCMFCLLCMSQASKAGRSEYPAQFHTFGIFLINPARAQRRRAVVHIRSDTRVGPPRPSIPALPTQQKMSFRCGGPICRSISQRCQTSRVRVRQTRSNSENPPTLHFDSIMPQSISSAA